MLGQLSQTDTTLTPEELYRDLHVSSSQPTRHELSTAAQRLETFKNYWEWPHGRPFTPEHMAECGFFIKYFTGHSADSVACFYCGVILNNFKVDEDNLFIEHAKYIPDCGYLNRLCPRELFLAIKDLLSEHSNKTPACMIPMTPAGVLDYAASKYPFCELPALEALLDDGDSYKMNIASYPAIKAVVLEGYGVYDTLYAFMATTDNENKSMRSPPLHKADTSKMLQWLIRLDAKRKIPNPKPIKRDPKCISETMSISDVIAFNNMMRQRNMCPNCKTGHSKLFHLSESKVCGHLSGCEMCSGNAEHIYCAVCHKTKEEALSGNTDRKFVRINKILKQCYFF